jgi:GT2 family glycosyltransferase
MPEVSVMIPTTIGGFVYLAALMPQLREEVKVSDAEIIIVDNASRDGTTNYLSNYDCLVKINSSNLGFSKAHNQAARVAQGKYLLLLNNDTQITPGFINKMKQTFDIDPNIGIVGCAIWMLEGEKRVQHAGVMFTDTYVPYELGLPVPSIAPGIPFNDPRVKQTREVPSVTFACVMIKKECWDDVGGLDEEYVNGWEDTDFVLKAKEKGWKVWYSGDATIKHKKHGSAGRHNFEGQNRARYDSIWVTTGRAKSIIGEGREM